LYRNERRFGVVKWIDDGDNEVRQNNRIVAVEIEGDMPYEWRTMDLMQLKEAQNAGVFVNAGLDSIALVPYCSLRPDDRFATSDIPEILENCDAERVSSSNFGSLDSGVEKNGRNSFCSILASRCATAADSIHTEVTDILKTEIVYPLRRFHFVRADHVFNLRRLLERFLPEMSGLTTGEKDPEELLNALFNTVLRVEPFFVMKNTTDGKTSPSFICPLITEDLWSDDQRRLISVQALLERSLFASNIQFASEPKVLILQLPRYGQQKVFDKIFPSQEVDVTHLIHAGKRPCIGCGKLANVMCPECFLTQEVLICEVTYCTICYDRAHCGLDHQPQHLQVSSAFSSLSLSRRTQIPQKKLQLASVLCIETSHYVAFVRAMNANKWLFFDSMADRVGLSDGFNVPQVKLCDKMSNWLSDSGWAKMRDCVLREGHLPNDVASDPDLMRLLSDCYICFYTDEENRNEGLSLTRFFT
uniref:Ubiquitinyl hydrolase 1 n=1 Tax=Gongylonema pulchrum TaxID=637853 RepID=A0A183DX84_9BILA